MPAAPSIRSQFRALSPPARLLVVNQLGVTTGFYMVLPYLATHLTEDLGYAAALVGVVIGVRALAQQGLFPLGGTVADRVGYRPMIMLGCAVRVVAFGLFAWATAPVGILTAAALTGAAGALFNPAVRAYLTRESGTDRAGAFAVLNTASDTGAFVGPLVGALLLVVDFRLAAAVASAVFLVLTIAQAFVLPAREVDVHTEGVLTSWGAVLRNRRFLAFALCTSVGFALYQQVFLVLPLEARRVTGTPASVSVLFAVSTLVGVLLYVPVAAWAKRRWAPGTCVAVGDTLIAVAFVPVGASALLLPTSSGLDLVAGLPVLAGSVVFILGQALSSPFQMEVLPVVGDERLIGTYYGFHQLVAALVAAGASAGAGALIDLGGAGGRTAAVVALVVLGLVGAAGTAVLQGRGLLSGS